VLLPFSRMRSRYAMVRATLAFPLTSLRAARDSRDQRPHTAEAEQQHPAEPRAIELPCKLSLQEVQLVPDLGEVAPRLVGLVKVGRRSGLSARQDSVRIPAASRNRVTSSERSDPNANTPNGRASGRGAHPTRSLGAPVRSAVRCRVQPGLPLPGGSGAACAETDARATKPASVAIVRISASIGDRWPECARQRLIQPERA